MTGIKGLLFIICIHSYPSSRNSEYFTFPTLKGVHEYGRRCAGSSQHGLLT